MADTVLTASPLNPTEHSLTIEGDVLALVEEEAVVGLDTLVTLCPQYSWSQVFHAVDRLARQGAVTLRRHRSDYTLFSNHYAA